MVVRGGIRRDMAARTAVSNSHMDGLWALAHLWPQAILLMYYSQDVLANQAHM